MDAERRQAQAPAAAELERRPGRFADRFWLDDLRRAAYRDLFDAISGGCDEARHRRHFASCWGRGGIELLLLEGQPIGMLQAASGDGRLELSELQIHPAHQNRGWGARAVRGLMAAAAQAGLDIELGTGLHNTGAQRLYARLDFRETSRSETHVHMRWSPASELT
ncbi:MAG: GNAT family N-acetyltransferase [Planctomycetota bacterium]|jgi:ribosomal protein S18 acetylase RimI-like enzyme